MLSVLTSSLENESLSQIGIPQVLYASIWMNSLMLSCVSRLLSHQTSALEPCNLLSRIAIREQSEQFPREKMGHQLDRQNGYRYRRLDANCNWLRFLMKFGPTAQADLFQGKSNTVVVVNLFDIAQANTNRYSVSKP